MKFFSNSSSWNLLGHQTIRMPVIVSQLPSILEVVHNFLPQCAQFASKRNLRGVNFSQINFSWLLKDDLWLDILVRRFVSGVKWTVETDVSVFESNLFLIAILSICLLEFVQNFLFHRHLMETLLFQSLWCVNLNTDFGAGRPEVWVKTLLSAKRMVRVKYIKWLYVQLVSASNQLRYNVTLFRVILR